MSDKRKEAFMAGVSSVIGVLTALLFFYNFRAILGDVRVSVFALLIAIFIGYSGPLVLSIILKRIKK